MSVMETLSDLPLSLTVPAGTALLAYLNARHSLFYDAKFMKAFGTAVVRRFFWTRNGRSNLFYMLEQHAQSSKLGSEPFLVYRGEIWTFYDTYKTVLRYGNWLKKAHQVKPGDVVAMDFMNSPTFVFVWFGIWSIGAIPSMINFNLVKTPLEHCVRICDAKLLLVDEELRSNFPPEQVAVFNSPDFRTKGGPVEVVIHDALLESEIMATEPKRPRDSDRANQEVDSTCMYIYTSGTTGLPKAAIITWGKTLTGSGFISSAIGLRQSDRLYTCMPLYHSTAALLGCLTCLVNGSSLAIGRKFSARNFWNEVREDEATIIQYVGEALRYVLATAPQIDPETGENMDKKHNVRMAFGNGLRPDVWNRFKERFGVETIAEFYGATEGMSLSLNVSSNNFASGAIGRNGLLTGVFFGLTSAIIDLDPITEVPRRDRKTGLCIEAKRGEPGELLYALDAENVEAKFPGYINNDDANHKKVIRDVRKKGDAWFRTGDMIRWNSNGLWYFSDRLGDTFRWRSENVSTSEVSQILGNHPHVQEANVYGVEVPHHDGRAGCAAIVFKEEGDGAAESSPNPSHKVLQSLATHASSQLPKYAVPLFLRVTAAMQATGNNKQQKTTLRAEGVDIEKLEESKTNDRIYWLNEGTYIPFEKKDWHRLNGGQVKL